MTHLARTGNSFAVRIPKAVLSQVGFNEKTNLAFKVLDEGLLITPVRHPREGWTEAFQTKRQQETLLMGDKIINEFDKDEWEW